MPSFWFFPFVRSFIRFIRVCYFISKAIHHISLNDWTVMHSHRIYNAHKCSNICLWLTRTRVVLVQAALLLYTHARVQSQKRKNKKEIEFYVTVTKRNLISFRFIRLYNFRKFSLCIHNNGCSKHCCYTIADIIAASAVADATVCLTYIQANVSTTPTNVCM